MNMKLFMICGAIGWLGGFFAGFGTHKILVGETIAKFVVGEKYPINGEMFMAITKVDAENNITIIIPNNPDINTGDTLCLAK